MDKISSPEQLNEAMKVAGPGVWCMLAGLAAVFAAFIVWGFLGSIPETVEITGTVLSAGAGKSNKTEVVIALENAPPDGITGADCDLKVTLSERRPIDLLLSVK